MLPQLTTPVYRHFLTGLGKEIEFRPFTVKEQKILLMAKQDGSKDAVMQSIEQILTICTFNKIDIKNLASFDLIDLLIRIRAKSVDNIAAHTYKYKWVDSEGVEKEERVVVKIDLDKIKVTTSEEHNRVIMLEPNIGIKLRYPTFNDIGKAADEYEQIARQIETIFQGDDVYSVAETPFPEILAFVDTFSAANIAQVKKFFATMPKVYHEQEIKLKDGTTELIKYESIEDFFN